MAKHRSLQQLSKLITYILGRRPDEFGLVLNSDGQVKIKELLKAICEEKDWKYVRRSHINDIFAILPNPPIEISDKLIRAKHRDSLPQHLPAKNLPKLLYTCVRSKAYPSVIEKGISPSGDNKVVLSSSREMAERMGKRMDHTAILLTVHAEKSIQEGVVFYQAGGRLYIAESIPTGCFTGPPLPKHKMESKEPANQKQDMLHRLAGSYIVNLEEKKEHKRRDRDKKKRREIARKKDIKQRERQKKERPPWRS